MGDVAERNGRSSGVHARPPAYPPAYRPHVSARETGFDLVCPALRPSSGVVLSSGVGLPLGSGVTLPSGEAPALDDALGDGVAPVSAAATARCMTPMSGRTTWTRGGTNIRL